MQVCVVFVPLPISTRKQKITHSKARNPLHADYKKCLSADVQFTFMQSYAAPGEGKKSVSSLCRDVISSEAADSRRRPLARGVASSCSFSRTTMDWKPVDRAHLSPHVHAFAFLSPSSSFPIKSLSTEFTQSWSIWCQVSSVRSIIIILNPTTAFRPTDRLSSDHYHIHLYSLSCWSAYTVW